MLVLKGMGNIFLKTITGYYAINSPTLNHITITEYGNGEHAVSCGHSLPPPRICYSQNYHRILCYQILTVLHISHTTITE